MSDYKKEQHRIFRKLEKSHKNRKNVVSVVKMRDDYINDNQICLTSVVFLSSDL